MIEFEGGTINQCGCVPERPMIMTQGNVHTPGKLTTHKLKITTSLLLFQ